jgi:chaperone modulatory protein CbpM
MTRRYKIAEVSRITGIEGSVLVEYVRREWIQPAEETFFDDEDLTRARLIRDLMDDFQVNDEGVPIILHLIDQLHCLHQEIKRLKPFID